jgi:4-diphosphocytidyl-2C-methyl-D-erythritol kinase
LNDSYQWPLHNDFEAVIFEIEPEIKRAKIALLDAGAQGALLAGSGSCVFGIFSGEGAREGALGSLRVEAGWRIFSCDTLSRNEYLRSMGSFATPLSRSFNMLSDTGA